MKLRLSCYITGGPVEHRPGDIVDFDDTEAARLIEIGAGRVLTADEQAALPEEPKPTAKTAKSKG